MKPYARPRERHYLEVWPCESRWDLVGVGVALYEVGVALLEEVCHCECEL